MTNQEILAMVDHTLLKADAKKEDIKRICEEAMENNTASICINPGFIEYAVGILGDKIPVCTVIGFPLGAMTTAAKVFEAKDAIEKAQKKWIWLSTSAEQKTVTGNISQKKSVGLNKQ